MGRVLPPGGTFGQKALCPACQQTTSKRLCPHCHMEQPHTIGRYRSLIFALIGAKEAGKSHYLAVLIEQIRKHVGPSLGLLLEPMNDATIRRYRHDFYDRLYQHGAVIEATQSALANGRVQMPLVYSLTLTRQTAAGKPRIWGVVTLVFFDTAGEDLDDEDVMATVNKYIYRADGIVLLLDPLQLKRVRARLNGALSLPEVNTESETILVRTTKLIRLGRGQALTTCIRAPLAVAFSKFDAVESLLDPQLQLHSNSNHREGFDVDDFEAVNAEMQALLEQWDSGVIPQEASTHYRKFGFFGVSALGCQPLSNGHVPRILPRRVEDPFLWLLYCHRLIPARRHR
ncbi:MAG TPA: GTPase domain-containing protein [Thermoanaerobaculia bacterium]|nr:GTPase domain-containing protein [Thermoanaerobaculia bacterium]